MNYGPTIKTTAITLASAILLAPMALNAAEETVVEKQRSAIELGGPFSNNAVFQQQIPVPVWGTSRPGAKILVDFDKQTKRTVAKSDGSWKVTLDPMTADKLSSLSKAPEGKTLTVTGTLGKETAIITLENILVGEVWLCSGQSNMAAKVRHNHANQDPNDNLLESNYPAVRHISAPGGWQMATPEHVREFTRVGFCFARKVHLEQKVPIGLLNACAGGSRIESWMRVPPTKLPSTDPKQRQVTYGLLYTDRLAPLVGYGIRGALWYQGEANAGEGHTYFLKMESLISDWRNSWHLGDFPFYIVQLAGIGQSSNDNPAMGDGRAKIRESQRQVLNLKNTGMAVAVDIGSEREHPANKVEVGIRLAHWALHHAYDRSDVVPSGPLYKSHRIEGATIRLSFDSAKSGLMIAEKKDYHPPRPTPSTDLPWLSIQAKDGSWHWAKGVVDGSDLIVSSRKVKEPIAVRYAYTQHPLGSYLYNQEGLPASPFSTCGY